MVAIATSDKVYQMVEEYHQKGFAYHGVIGDLSSLPQLEQAFQQSLDLLGGQLDILVNCAGIQRRHPCDFRWRTGRLSLT